MGPWVLCGRSEAGGNRKIQGVTDHVLSVVRGEAVSVLLLPFWPAAHLRLSAACAPPSASGFFFRAFTYHLNLRFFLQSEFQLLM